ncbi:MAG: DNA alkylation repair protein [Pyrinomonadaceae bacterium]
MPRRYVKKLETLFRANADAEIAIGASKYMREKFPFLGIKAPKRIELLKEFVSAEGKPDAARIQDVCRALYALPEREFHYAAIYLTGALKGNWDDSWVSHFEMLMTVKSWWDSVDGVNSVCLKPFFRKRTKHAEATARIWAASDNFWLQRASLIFQLGYRNETNTRLLEENIRKLADSDEFFVQKAIGWILRDYARTDKEFVIRVLEDVPLAALSVREARKHF